MLQINLTKRKIWYKNYQNKYDNSFLFKMLLNDNTSYSPLIFFL